MPRGMYPHRYKKKVETSLPPKQFLGFLEKAKEYRDLRREKHGTNPWFKDINIVALLAFLYYSGLRVTEIVGDPPHKYRLKDGTVKMSKEIKGITKEDLAIEGSFLKIYATEVRKKGERYSPLWIPVDKPGVNEIIATWGDTKRGRRLFPISRSYAWMFIKEVTGDLYPHYFRLNRATRFAEHPETSIKDLKDWFGWKRIESASPYMAKGGRATKEMAERM